MGNSWLPVRLMDVCGCVRHPRNFIWEMLNSRSVSNPEWSVRVADSLPYQQAILALKFSPSGKWLLVGGLNPAIQLWNIVNKTLEKQYPADNGKRRPFVVIDRRRADGRRSQLFRCRMDRRLEVRNLWRRQSDTCVPVEYDETDPRAQVSYLTLQGSQNLKPHSSFVF